MGAGMHKIGEPLTGQRKISQKQLDILAIVEHYIEIHKVAPSCRALAAILECTHQNAHYHLQTLVKRGLLSRGCIYKARSWRSTRNPR